MRFLYLGVSVLLAVQSVTAEPRQERLLPISVRIDQVDSARLEFLENVADDSDEYLILFTELAALESNAEFFSMPSTQLDDEEKKREEVARAALKVSIDARKEIVLGVISDAQWKKDLDAAFDKLTKLNSGTKEKNPGTMKEVLEAYEELTTLLKKALDEKPPPFDEKSRKLLERQLSGMNTQRESLAKLLKVCDVDESLEPDIDSGLSTPDRELGEPELPSAEVSSLLTRTIVE